MYKNIRIATVTPTRGDRPEFLEHSKRLMERQTVRPDMRIVVDYPPRTEGVDIKERYRAGLERAFNGPNPADIAFFIEDDDWYYQDYIRIMADEWLKAGRPVLCGINNIIYYHIKNNLIRHLQSPSWSSAMNMAVTREALDLNWGDMAGAFLDLDIFKGNPNCRKALAEPTLRISIGIKHGVGKCGSGAHNP